MRFLSNTSKSIVTLLALLSLDLNAAHVIHVAPSGNDINPGTAAQPVKTPQGAQVRGRSLIQSSPGNAVEIIFEAGNYQLESPLELRPEDSGTAEFPITWKSEPGAKVVWSGGLAIPQKWDKGDDGVWHVDLKGIGPDGWNFRQLIVDGKSATRARFPNGDAPNPFLYATGGDMDHLIIEPALV